MLSSYFKVSLSINTVPYVSAQYPENSTDSLPGDLPYFMTPDFNEIKPLSVYEPYVLYLIL